MSVKEFQSLPQALRYSYHLIFGHNANELLDFIHPDTITLTVLRDPIDRIVSHYFYVKQEKRHYLHERVMKSNIQLEDYVSYGLSTELRNWYTTYFTGLSIEEAETEAEESVRRAAEVILGRYDIIGFQDDLSAVMIKLRNAAKLSKPFDAQVRYLASRRISLQEVPKNIIKTISEVNFLDVKFYALLKKLVGSKIQ